MNTTSASSANASNSNTAAGGKGKTKLARDYYLMQAFVQQGHLLSATQSHPNHHYLSSQSSKKSASHANLSQKRSRGGSNTITHSSSSSTAAAHQQQQQKLTTSQSSSLTQAKRMTAAAAQQSYYKTAMSAALTNQDKVTPPSLQSSTHGTVNINIMTSSAGQKPTTSEMKNSTRSRHQNATIGSLASPSGHLQTPSYTSSASAGKLKEAQHHHNSLVASLNRSQKQAPIPTVTGNKIDDLKTIMHRSGLLSAEGKHSGHTTSNPVMVTSNFTFSSKKKKEKSRPMSTSRTGSTKQMQKQVEGTVSLLQNSATKEHHQWTAQKQQRLTNTYQKSGHSTKGVTSPLTAFKPAVESGSKKSRSTSRDASLPDCYKLARKNLMNYAASAQILKQPQMEQTALNSFNAANQQMTQKSKKRFTEATAAASITTTPQAAPFSQRRSKSRTKNSKQQTFNTIATTTTNQNMTKHQSQKAKPLVSERQSHQAAQLMQQQVMSSNQQEMSAVGGGSTKPPLALTSVTSPLHPGTITSTIAPSSSRNSLPHARSFKQHLNEKNQNHHHQSQHQSPAQMLSVQNIKKQGNGQHQRQQQQNQAIHGGKRDQQALQSQTISSFGNQQIQTASAQPQVHANLTMPAKAANKSPNAGTGHYQRGRKEHQQQAIQEASSKKRNSSGRHGESNLHNLIQNSGNAAQNGGFRNRIRSTTTSNERQGNDKSEQSIAAQQTTSHSNQGQLQTKSRYTVPNANTEAPVSGTDWKRKEGLIAATATVVTKRKKSATKRGKSLKRSSQPLQPSVENRGRSPNTRNMRPGDHTERHQSPNSSSQKNALGSTTIYSAYRQRAVKPKKSGRERENENTISTNKFTRSKNRDVHHTGSMSIEKNELYHPLNVGLLSVDSTMTGQQMFQSASASHSICSQNALTVKDAKLARNQLSKQQKVAAGKVRRIVNKKAVHTERKKNSSDISGSHKKVDLMKASILTAEAAQLQKQSQLVGNRNNQLHLQFQSKGEQMMTVNRTPSQMSQITFQEAEWGGTKQQYATMGDGLLQPGSMQVSQAADLYLQHEQQEAQTKGGKVFVKHRSISSDEHLRMGSSASATAVDPTSSPQEKHVHQNQCMTATKSTAGGSRGGNSPKFLLSLRQLEDLLFSTQKISAQLRASTLEQSQIQQQFYEEKSRQDAEMVKRALIQNSLKFLNEPEEQKTEQAVIPTKTQKDKQESQQRLPVEQPLRDDEKPQNQIEQVQVPEQPQKSPQVKKPTAQQAVREKRQSPAKEQQEKQRQQSQSPSRGVISKRQQSNLLSLINMQKSRALHLQQQQQQKQYKVAASSPGLERGAAVQVQNFISNEQADPQGKQGEEVNESNEIVMRFQDTEHERQQVVQSVAEDENEDEVDEFQSPGKEEDSNGAGEIMTIEVQQSSPAQPREEQASDKQNSKPSIIPAPLILAHKVASQGTPSLAKAHKRPASVNSITKPIDGIASNDASDSAKQLDSLIYGQKTLNFGRISSKTSNHASSNNRHEEMSPVKIENQQENDSSGGADEQQSIISPAMVQIELQMRNQQKSETRSNLIQTSQSVIDQSYLERVQASNISRSKGAAPILGSVEDTTPANINAMLINEDEKDEVSICSVKQPSLRQITSSHKSSSNKRLHCQESTEHRKSQQDPNASITLSRLLLETSMQQSERAVAPGHAKEFVRSIGSHRLGQASEIGAIAAYSTTQVQRNPRMRTDQMIENISEQQNLNIGRSQTQKLVDGRAQSEVSARQKVIANPNAYITTGREKEDKEEGSQHRDQVEEEGYFKPESTSSVNNVSSMTPARQSSQPPPKGTKSKFMADEAWPSSSDQKRQRNSSVSSSLNNSIQGSRLLEQLQQNNNNAQQQQSDRSIHLSPQKPTTFIKQQQQLYSPISQKTQIQFDDHGEIESASLLSDKLAEFRKGRTSNIQKTLASLSREDDTDAYQYRLIIDQNCKEMQTNQPQHSNQMLNVEDQAEVDVTSSKPTGSVGMEEPTQTPPLSPKKTNNENREKNEPNNRDKSKPSLASNSFSAFDHKNKTGEYIADDKKAATAKTTTNKFGVEAIANRGTSSPDKRSNRIKFPIEYEPQDSKSYVNEEDIESNLNKIADQDGQSQGGNQAQNDSQYIEAPFEKSRQEDDEGLNLILFQGRADEAMEGVRIGRIDGHSRTISHENLLSSIHSTQDNNQHQFQQNDEVREEVEEDSTPQEQIQVLTPKRQQNVAKTFPNQNSAGKASDIASTSQLAAIEDVLGCLSPAMTDKNTVNTQDCLGSLVSVDSDQLMRGAVLEPSVRLKTSGKLQQANSMRDLSTNMLKRSPNTEIRKNKMMFEDNQSTRNFNNQRMSEKQLDKYCNEEEADEIDQQISLHQIRDETTSPLELADLQVGQNSTERQTPENLLVPTMLTNAGENINSDQKPRTVSRATVSSQASQMPLATSTTHDLDFEVAQNMSEQSPAPAAIPPPAEALKQQALPLYNPIKELADGAGATKSNRLFDIDSLNAIKKANDLASKKVEITNQIFDMLVKEISDDLFPARGNQRRRSKGKKRRRTPKPSVMPKVKEIVNGHPVDMCLKRIQIQAKLRSSVAISLEGSQSAGTFQSATTFSRDGERLFNSYMENTKSKELLVEASSQFYQIEQRKQEQNDLLIKLVNESDSMQNAAKLNNRTNKKKAPGLRGIKTTTDVLLTYLNTLFSALMEDENVFLESLATPYSLNTLQELINLQVLSKHAAQLTATQSLPKLMSEKQRPASPYGGALLTTSISNNMQDQELEMALYGQQLNQQPILSVEVYLEIERKKEYVLLADSISELSEDIVEEEEEEEEDDDQNIEDEVGGAKNKNQDSKQAQTKKPAKKAKECLEENQSMLAEWENIHNKVLFDAVNDQLDEYRPYGLKGPPAPWSGQTRALTYRYSQNGKEVLDHVREKVVNLSKTFGGALANSELLREYHIRGPLDEDKLMMLREERLAIMMMQDVEETQHKWDDLERQESGIKLDLAEMLLDQLTSEIVDELSEIGSRSFQ